MENKIMDYKVADINLSDLGRKENLLAEILQNQKTKRIFENKKIKKYFFVKNRLINVLI